jgi:hypothetical protein
MFGTWKTHVRRLVRPLSGSNTIGSKTWVEMNGTTVVRKVLDGRANLVELTAEGPGSRFEGLSLRLYSPQTRQWSLHFANSSNGILDRPTIGEFKDGRGEFYSQDTLEGRAIFVRFTITQTSPDLCRFEQDFSAEVRSVRGTDAGGRGHLARGHCGSDSAGKIPAPFVLADIERMRCPRPFVFNRSLPLVSLVPAALRPVIV